MIEAAHSIAVRCVCAAALLAMLVVPRASAEELRAWRHGVIEPKGDSGFSMMISRRGFGERRGLKIEIVVLKNGALAHKALLAGEVESIESSPGAAIMAGARGADLKIVGCDWRGVPQGLFVRAPIAAVEDLKGKTLATAAPGSMPDLLARALLEKHGIPVSEVRFANLGGDLERYKAVVAGIADAGVVAAEFLSVAPENIRQIVAGRDVLPNYVRLCLTMTGKTLGERREDAARFLAAQVEALRYALSHRDETVALSREIIGAKPGDPRAAFAFDDTVRHSDVDPDISLPMDKLEWMQGQLVKTGNMRQTTDLSRLVDADVREKALALAGK